MRESPVIALAECCDLPDDGKLKEELMQDLAKTFAEYGVSPDHIKLFDGDMYAQTNVHTQCPECRERLKFGSFELGPENGARAGAVCSCGWSGDAIYRLIDLHEDDVDEETKNNRTELEPESCVANNILDVIYTPYTSTDHYLLNTDDI